MEKSYFEILNEISSEELYEGLLGYGLFCEKIPPFLSSEMFLEYCSTVSQNIPCNPAQYVYYESIRNTNIPRQMGIPSPFLYHRLCKCLQNNWEQLKNHFQINTENQDYRVSRTHIRKLKNSKRLFEMNYNNWRIDGTPEPDLLIGSKFIVKADVSNFFPSIYTHSIPWALVGKATAKINQDRPKLWYNKIDAETRRIKYNETHGLLIGPHVSNLLSEIIMVVIDKELIDKKWRFTRHIDDFTCYVSTYEEGQLFLLDLAEQLRSFGLALNHKKTKINELPLASAAQWIRRVNSHTLSNSDEVVNFLDVRSYMDLVVELMHENDTNSAIINYAIKVLSKKELSTNARNYYVKTIFHLALIYPYLIPLLDEYVFSPFAVDTQDISKFADKALELGCNSKNYELISYVVYFAIKYKFDLPRLTIDMGQDCISLLLIYLYFKKNGNEENVGELKKMAKNLVEFDFDQYWVFVYEVLSASELKEAWVHMKKKNITFLKSEWKNI